jgi:integrase
VANQIVAPGELVSLEALYLERGRLDAAFHSPITIRGYTYDFLAFQKWAGTRGLAALPASVETISLYCTEKLTAGRKTATVARLAAGIAHRHRKEGFPVDWGPRVQQLLRGSRRIRPEKLEQVRPLTIPLLREMSIALKLVGTPLAMRDRALLVSGFGAGLRSASIVALLVEDVEFTEKGAVVQVRHEKTQDGSDLEPPRVGIPHAKHSETDGVICLREWLAIRSSTLPGALFCRARPHIAGVGLHPNQVRRVVHRSLRLIGQDPKGFGGHSLRVGLACAAYEAGVPERVIQAQTLHRSVHVLRRYFRRDSLFRANALSYLDL